MRRSTHVGSRNIRSAGRGSGSVEITLPVAFSALEGVSCQVELRDSLVPEILLRPNLGFLLSVFEALWDRVALGLEGIGDVGAFSEADYVVGLFAETNLSGRPGLAYEDALRVHRQVQSEEAGGGPSCIAAPSLEAYARMIDGMATVAAGRLGLSIGMAVLFGNQTAYAATGASVAAVDAFARSSLADLSPDIGWCRSDPLDEGAWVRARPRLKELFNRLSDWEDDAAGMHKEREHWYRAHRLEARSPAVRA